MGPSGFNKTFSKWLDNKTYRDMIADGKGKLEWDRKVPDEKIANLKELLNCEAFNENLPDVSTILLRCQMGGRPKSHIKWLQKILKSSLPSLELLKVVKY